VREQNLSPEQVMRMNTEHETLSRNLEDLKHRISETQKTVMTLEVQVANRAEAAEQAVDSYTNTLSALGLFPPLPPPWEDIDLTLELNTALKDPQALLSGADIRKTVRPTLGAIAESKRLERAEVEDEKVKVENDLDQLTTECENMEEEIMELEKKVDVLNEQADDLREVRLLFCSGHGHVLKSRLIIDSFVL
jgi:kinetochore protein NDC80